MVRVKLVPIGNSRGVRIPHAFIKACNFGDHVEMRLERDTLVLAVPRHPRENWDAAFEAMAASGDDALLIPDNPADDWDEAEWSW